MDNTHCTDSHEWIRVDGDTIELGLTAHAVQELTDVTFVEIQPAGTMLTSGDSLGEVESVKTTSDIYTALAGEVSEANQAVVDDPSLVNSDPYGEGWLVRIASSDLSPLDGLMDAEAYDQMNG